MKHLKKDVTTPHIKDPIEKKLSNNPKIPIKLIVQINIETKFSELKYSGTST